MRTLLLATSAALALTGCSGAVATADRPAIVLPDRYALAPAAVDAASSQIDPGTLLPTNDPAFTALIGRLSSAPDLGVAIARVDAARAAAQRSAAELRPSLDASARSATQRISPNQFGALPGGFAIDRYQSTFAGDLTARWDADIFGGIKANARAARERLSAAGHDADAVRIALITEVAAAVSDWRSIEERRAAITGSANAAEQRARLIAQRAKSGLASQLDAERAQSLAEGMNAALAPLDGQEAAVLGRLVALTGAPPQAIRDDLRQSARIAESRPAPVTVPSDLLTQRPDIRAAYLRLAASDSDVAAAAARRFPRLTISSALGLLSFSVSELFNSEALTAQLGASIAGPLIDFGRTRAEIDASKAQAQVAFEQLRQTIFGALGQTESAIGRLQSTQQELEQLTAQDRREHEIARLTAVRHRAGLESLTVSLDADRAAFAARLQTLIRQAEERRARIALWQAIGGPGQTGLLTTQP